MSDKHENKIALDAHKVGVKVTCRVCGRTKKPYGRDAPGGTCYCRGGECEGYLQQPQVGQLWPGETEVDFGSPVCSCCGVVHGATDE